jgi:hypothetical protein
MTADTRIRIPGVDPDADIPDDPLPPELAAKANDLVAKLASDDWATREQALKDLVAMGPKIRPLMAKVAKEHPDAEVRYRAATVLERVREPAIAVKSTGSFHPQVITLP